MATSDLYHDGKFELAEPTTPFGTLLRNLADAAMSVTHHDAAQDEPGYRHEVETMERKFGPLIRSYVAAQKRRSKARG